MSIEVKNLTKIYGEQKAVNDISFSIGTGEIVGFLGPNGAGKSTTMKMLTSYILPSYGSVKVSGFDVMNEPLNVRKNIGYLPENNPLYYDMYVKEYLYFIAGVSEFKGNKSNRIKELIDLTGLEVEQKKKIGALSKGYKQRVGLAQALFHNPKVLILDEPTTGLDPNQIIEIRNLIKEVGKEKTVIFSSHILQEVEAVCNRVIIINSGIIVADSPTIELKDRFTGNATINVQFEKLLDKEKLLKIKGVLDVKQNANFSYTINVDKDREIRKELFQLAVKEENPIFELKMENRSLENIFRELTNNQLTN